MRAEISNERRYESKDSREMEKGSMGARVGCAAWELELVFELREVSWERREKKDFLSGGEGYSRS